MKALSVLSLIATLSLAISGCSLAADEIPAKPEKVEGPLLDSPILTKSKDIKEGAVEEIYSKESTIQSVKEDALMQPYSRLLFPTNSAYYSGRTLGDLQLTWYSHIKPERTVAIVNYLHNQVAQGIPVFYDIYTEQEKQADPAKRNTGLFYFRGQPGNKLAVLNAGGGFAYVGAMHDSFPHALALAEKGYNAFALIYRPGARTATEDLARALSFIFANANTLQVDTTDYSLWGGSAGGRMVGWLGSYGAARFGGADIPKPGAVIIQYTGLQEYTPNDPPTYVNVGDRDGIADWRVMEHRIHNLKAQGIPTEFHVYPGLGHGYGLGEGTVAEGWLTDAVHFWEAQMK